MVGTVYADNLASNLENPFWFTFLGYIILLFSAGLGAYAGIQTRTVDVWRKHAEALKEQLDFLDKRVTLLSAENVSLKDEILKLQVKTDVTVVFDKIEEHNQEFLRVSEHFTSILNSLNLTLEKISQKIGNH